MRFSSIISFVFAAALGAITVQAAPLPQSPIIPTRPPAAKPPVLKGGGSGRETANILVESIAAIVQANAAGQADRAEFTKKTITDLTAKDPKRNYVVVHTKHRTKFEGVEGKDWVKTHVEHRNKHTGGTGYDIYSFGAGEFWLEGDGGWLNWAYQGNLKSRNGNHLIFNKP